MDRLGVAHGGPNDPKNQVSGTNVMADTMSAVLHCHSSIGSHVLKNNLDFVNIFAAPVAVSKAARGPTEE